MIIQLCANQPGHPVQAGASQHHRHGHVDHSMLSDSCSVAADQNLIILHAAKIQILWVLAGLLVRVRAVLNLATGTGTRSIVLPVNFTLKYSCSII